MRAHLLRTWKRRRKARRALRSFPRPLVETLEPRLLLTSGPPIDPNDPGGDPGGGGDPSGGTCSEAVHAPSPTL
jgi:hypothetical protein